METMLKTIVASFLTLTTIGLMSLGEVRKAEAQAPITITFTGEITSVDDSLGWFNNNYPDGKQISGSYTFYDSGYSVVSFDPGFHNLYQFDTPTPDFRLKSGANELKLGPSPVNIPFQISVWNDMTSGIFPDGDGYSVNSPVEFPSFYHDFTGDPIADPNFFFFPYVGVSLFMSDPTGTALSSINLPLTAPNLASFANSSGLIYIGDGNGNDNYANAYFRITSLHSAVPEPGYLALLVGLGVASSGLLKRKLAHKS